MQLNALTGGDNGAVRFDLNGDGNFTAADQVTVAGNVMSPVGRNMGGGVRSQLTALDAGDVPGLPGQLRQEQRSPAAHRCAASPAATSTTTSTTTTSGGLDGTFSIRRRSEHGNSPFCLKTTSVGNDVGRRFRRPTARQANGYPADYDYMTRFTTGAACGAKKAGPDLQTIYCSRHTTSTTAGKSYANKKHVHEYDDKSTTSPASTCWPRATRRFNLPNAYTGNLTPARRSRSWS